MSFRGTLEVPLAPRFEHGVVPIDEPMKVAEAIVEPGSLALVPVGYERLRIEERAGAARLLLLGGEPLGVEIKMWWNFVARTFVARTFEEITEAWRAWKEHDHDRCRPPGRTRPGRGRAAPPSAPTRCGA